MTIYFNENKEAFGCEIENPLATIDDVTWANYATTDKWDIIDGEFIDISDTPEYEAEHLSSEKERIAQLIIQNYALALENGVFAINDTYYGNMSWYQTWTKAVALYSSALVLTETFTVRLYKKVDDTYYNYDTTQNLSTFKAMLDTLNSMQFVKYQPIRNNLISQVKLATTVEELEIIEDIIVSSFGDIINENTTIIEEYSE